MGLRTLVWDDRPETLDGISTSAELSDGPIDAAIEAAQLDAESAVVVVTRNVEVDVSILPALLASPAGYVGVMGSHRRWATTRDELARSGVTAADLDRVRSPIGIEIGAETPEEIAVSILGEIFGVGPGGGISGS